MGYAKNIRAELSRARRMYNRTGQSMTSLMVGIAIMGCVGAGAAKLAQSTHTQEQALSAKNGAAELMDTIADEIRTQTRYSNLAAKYDGKTFFSEDEFEARTAVTKVCNALPSANCDRADMSVKIVDKNTGEVVLKQSVTRAYTHYEESRAFASEGSLVIPQDAIAVRYISDGGDGNSGGSRTTYSYDLKINSAACARNYKPNSASPRPNGCVACPAPTGTKQYRSGDCTIGTCPTGQKANAAKTGCEAITCPSGQVLEGDNCVDDIGHGCYSMPHFSNYTFVIPESTDSTICTVTVGYGGSSVYTFYVPKKLLASCPQGAVHEFPIVKVPITITIDGISRAAKFNRSYAPGTVTETCLDFCTPENGGCEEGYDYCNNRRFTISYPANSIVSFVIEGWYYSGKHLKTPHYRYTQACW